SPHYIPHPVHLGDAGYALVFLAPGFEGTGSGTRLSVRQQTGMHTIMTTVEALRQKTNGDPLSYFLSLLLGRAHVGFMHDLLLSVSEAPVLIERLRERLSQVFAEEHARFLVTTGVSFEGYRRFLGDPEEACERGGLTHLLNGGQLRL